MAKVDFAQAQTKVPVAQEPPAPVPQKPATPVSRIPKVTESVKTDAAKVHTHERKEVYLRPGQYDTLHTESRRLQKARTVKGESITSNTLIRIAVDLLLTTKGDKLRGSTEEELRRSVGL